MRIKGIYGAVLNIVLSALFIGVAFTGYKDCLGKCCEMTFLSNAATGLVLFCSGICMLAGFNGAPHFLYLDCAVLMLTVFGVCAYFAPGVCFKGASVVPHIVTPAAITAFYLLFCDGREGKTNSVFSVLVFPFAYYAFMIVFGRASGSSVYSYFDTNALGAVKLGLAALAAYAALLIIALALQYVNNILRELPINKHRSSADV